MVHAPFPKTIPRRDALSAAMKPTPQKSSTLASPSPSRSSVVNFLKPGCGNLARVRVLVVEDAAVLAMLAEEFLVSFGCVIAGHAATSDEALKLVETVAIDIALLDIRLRASSS